MPTLLAQWGVDSALTSTTTPLLVPVPQTLPAGTLVVVGIASITTSAPTILVADQVGSNVWTVTSGRQSAGATSNVTLASSLLVLALPAGSNIVIGHAPSFSRHTIVCAAFSDATLPSPVHGVSGETTSTAVAGGAISVAATSLVFGATAFINSGRILTPDAPYTASVKHLSTAGSGNRGIQLVWRDANPGTYSQIGMLDSGGINLTVLGSIVTGVANEEWTAYPVKVWTGTAWVAKPSKYWNGTAWVAKPMKVFGPVRAGTTWGKAKWDRNNWDSTDRWGTARWKQDNWESSPAAWDEARWDAARWRGTFTDTLRESFNDLTRWVNGGAATVLQNGRTNTGVRITNNELRYTIPTPSLSTSQTVGFAYRVANIATARVICQFRTVGGGSNLFTLRVNTDGSLQALSGATVSQILSPAATLVVDTWYYLELATKISNTTGYASIRVNGVSLGTVTNVDTNAGFTEGDPIGVLALVAASPGTADYDDLYLRPDLVFQGPQTIR